MPGKSHGPRSLGGYSPWGCKESDTTERLHFLEDEMLLPHVFPNSNKNKFIFKNNLGSWRGKWEGGSGWGTHVNPWPIHVNVWQKPLQYCKKKKKKKLINCQEEIFKKYINKNKNNLVNEMLLAFLCRYSVGLVINHKIFTPSCLVRDHSVTSRKYWNSATSLWNRHCEWQNPSMG